MHTKLPIVCLEVPIVQLVLPSVNLGKSKTLNLSFGRKKSRQHKRWRICWSSANQYVSRMKENFSRQSCIGVNLIFIKTYYKFKCR